MSEDRGERRDPRLRDVLLLAAGAAGLAMCTTLMFYGMRSVMDVGGACADGGPFVPAQSCPDGAPAALVLGMFGWFGFGALTLVGGGLVGGGWAGAGILAWTALFAALGWNFLDYGLFNPPEGEVVWGWVIPGVMFQVMAFAPLVFAGGIAATMRTVSGEVRAGRGRAGSRTADAGPAMRPDVINMPGPAQEPRAGRDPGAPAATSTFTTVTVNGERLDDEAAREALAGVAAALDAAGLRALTGTPVGEILDDTSFTEGTQALLDRLERLADMRAQGLLDEAEYETAKDAVLRELEARKQA